MPTPRSAAMVAMATSVPYTVHGHGRGPDEDLVVAGRVAAAFTRMAPPRDGHAHINAVSDSHPRETTL